MSVASAHPMLELASAVAVDAFLGRQRYERRMLAEHGYRTPMVGHALRRMR